MIEFHPYYHDLMNLGITEGVPSFAWNQQAQGKKGTHSARSILTYLMYQLESGVSWYDA
jgi:putative acyl-CoA dehydrogenase